MQLLKEGVNMAYEIDFVCTDDVVSNADAIAIRWKNADSDLDYHYGVYDGGYLATGEALCEHIKKYYKTETLDFVVCSHPDQDHADGLQMVLENFKVNKLYMNCPWDYIDKLKTSVSDGRITSESLEKRLRDKYSVIDNLEKLALEKGITVQSCTKGTVIAGKWKVLSPSVEFYIKQVIASEKTPLVEGATNKEIYNVVEKECDCVKASWWEDALEDNPAVSAENEMSVVLLGLLDDTILLTGDAGVKALSASCEYAREERLPLREIVDIYQIPHHGSRQNISTNVMDEMVGDIVSPNYAGRIRKAFASTAKKQSDYPRRVVTNAYIRRGVRVYSTKGITIQHRNGMPAREGWSPVEVVEYTNEIES